MLNIRENRCDPEIGCSCTGDSPGVKPQVKPASATLSFRDHPGAWKARWGVVRMDHTVEPGLYAVGGLIMGHLF